MTDKNAFVEKMGEDAQRAIRELAAENEKLRELAAGLERQGRRLAEHMAIIEKQSADIANLYVATHRLHASVDRDELLATIQEIVANLLGCEEFAVYELDLPSRSLVLAHSMGIEPSKHAAVRVGDGTIGEVAMTGASYVADELPRTILERGTLPITACVPLHFDGMVTGVIALFRLLPQKAALEPVDRELLEVLSSHGAAALFLSRIYGKHRPTTRPPSWSRLA